MSDKLIRDELLRSHRYVSVSNDTAKLLFLHLTLASDSLSNAEATTTALSIIMGRAISETAAAALLTELADHDLVRLYEDGGKRYVHIPRSRQRIRYLSGKHPRPPDNVEDNEIKELIKKVGLQSDRGQTQVRPFTPEVLLPLPLKKTTTQPSVAGFDLFWSIWPKRKRKVAKWKCLQFWKTKNLEPSAAAIVAHVKAMAVTTQWIDYDPAPLTYLNQRRWLDDLQPDDDKAKKVAM